MALKQILDSLDGVDAAVQSLYTKAEDGKFYLDVEGLPEQREALKRANAEAAQRRKDLEKYKDIDPAKYAELVKEQDDVKRKAEDLATQEALRKGDYQKVMDEEAKKREQLLQKFSEKENSFAAREKKLLGQIERDRIESDAVKHFLEAGADPKRVHQLLKLTRENLKIEEGETGFDVRVVGPDGRPRLADATGALMGLKHFADEVKANVNEYGVFFTGTGASGGGAQPSKPGAGAKTMTRAQFDTLSPDAKSAFLVKDDGNVTD